MNVVFSISLLACRLVRLVCVSHNDFSYDINKTLGLQIVVNIDAYD